MNYWYLLFRRAEAPLPTRSNSVQLGTETPDVGRHCVTSQPVDLDDLSNDSFVTRHLVAVTDDVEVGESDLLGLGVHAQVVPTRLCAEGVAASSL